MKVHVLTCIWKGLYQWTNCFSSRAKLDKCVEDELGISIDIYDIYCKCYWNGENDILKQMEDKYPSLKDINPDYDEYHWDEVEVE
jgi:hypothetical protein